MHTTAMKSCLQATYHFTSLESQLVFLHNVDSHFLRQECLSTIILNSWPNVEICFSDYDGL